MKAGWQDVPRTVIVLSTVSLLNDMASEMVVPLIPVLLASVLAAGPLVLGLIEGSADAVAAMLKLWSGRYSDKLGGQRKGLAMVGYILSNVVRPLIGLVGSWPILLVLRSLDRVGKGLRSAPRDALIVDATPSVIRGLAFGLHRAFDNMGAVGGSLVAALALLGGLSLTQVIAWSAVPGMMAVMLLVVGVKQRRLSVVKAASIVEPLLHWRSLQPILRRYLWVLAVFTFARASETFIVLRGHELGMSVVELLVLWALLNLAKAMTSIYGGKLADKYGRLPVILIAWAGFGESFMLLAHVQHVSELWWMTALYGVLIGMTEGPERAMIGDFARVDQRGSAYGWYYAMTGLAAVPSGLLFGWLWQSSGAGTAFTYAGYLAMAATLMGYFWIIRPQRDMR